MPTATGYFTQKTVTTTTTTTKTVPKQKENVQYFTSQEKRYNNGAPPVPEPRNQKAVTNRDMTRILSDVKSDQNKNVVLDTLAALVTDCNATAEVLRSRSSSKTNVNDEQRDVRPYNDLYRTTEKTYETYRRSVSLPRSTPPPQPLSDQMVTTTTRSKILPGAVKVLPDAAPKRAEQLETEYTLKLHSPIYRTDGPTPEPKMPRLEDDKSPSLEKVCRDFDIEAPARTRSVSRPRSETPVSRKLIVLEEPKHYDAPICAACREHIYGPCITALAPNSKRAQKYHPPHFVCNYCLKPLNLKGTYREHELKPYCHECFYRLFSGHIYATENKISLDL